MTLGPTFFCFNKMAVTRRRKHLNQYFLAGSAAFCEIYHLAVSKRDLKPSGTFFRKFAYNLGFAGTRLSWIFAPGGRLRYEAYKDKNI